MRAPASTLKFDPSERCRLRDLISATSLKLERASPNRRTDSLGGETHTEKEYLPARSVSCRPQGIELTDSALALPPTEPSIRPSIAQSSPFRFRYSFRRIDGILAASMDSASVDSMRPMRALAKLFGPPIIASACDPVGSSFRLGVLKSLRAGVDLSGCRDFD